MTASSPSVLAQRYELQRLVARGGCGLVYRALDRRSGRTVAIKMLSAPARQDAHFVERLLREQQAMQALAGTHAVAAIDLCRTETGAVCLVMEWLDGIDMEQRLSDLEARGERMARQELLAILHPLLETLEKAHELGIVHRDIKPANIFLLSTAGGVRLLDFGFSRLKSSATLTAADTVMGSPSYIAPEAWKEGSKAMGRQADLYSMGVIVFRALTGQLPFEGKSLVETMRLVTAPARPSLCALRSDLPPVMDEWGKRALALDPRERFAFASHFEDALAAALDGLPLPEHTLPSAQPTHPTSIPPPRTTASERRGAFSAAVGRATALLKRLASSLTGTQEGPGEPAEPEAPVAALPSTPADSPRASEPSAPTAAPFLGERLQPFPTIPIQEPAPPPPCPPETSEPETSSEPEADPLIHDLLTAPSSPPSSPADELASAPKPKRSAKKTSRAVKPKRATRQQTSTTSEQRASEKPSARTRQRSVKKKRPSKPKPVAEAKQPAPQRKKVKSRKASSTKKAAPRASSRKSRAKK